MLILYSSLLCVVLIQLTTAQTCQNNRYVNGCSAFPIPYRQSFRPACNRHDICYACGARYGISRYRCDVAFRREMMNYCSRRFRFVKRLVCRKWAYLRFLSVRVGGRRSYRTTPARWCRRSWVPRCLP